MSIVELKALCDKLAVERTKLVELQASLKACNLSGHQHEITVSISGIGKVALSSQSRETGWASRVIRGREIILLGVKKSLSAIVLQQVSLVASIEEQLANARVDQ